VCKSVIEYSAGNTLEQYLVGTVAMLRARRPGFNIWKGRNILPPRP
jgi:hypothetical protein